MRYGSTSMRASRGSPPNASTVPRAERAERLSQRRRSRSLDHDVGAPGIRRGTAPKSGASSRRSGRGRADADGAATRVGDARAEHQPDRARPDDRDRVALATPATSTPWRQHASGSAIAATSDASLGRNGEEVAAGDPLGNEQELGVGAVQQREEVLAERLLAAHCTAGTRRTAPSWPRPPRARGDVDPADLVPERARRRAEEDGVPAPIGLRSVPSVSATST